VVSEAVFPKSEYIYLTIVGLENYEAGTSSEMSGD